MRRPPVRATLALAAVAVTAGVVVAVPTLRSSDPVDPPAALPDGAVDVRRDPSGTVRSLATEPGEPIHLSSTEPAAAADEFVDRYGQVLGPGELVTTSATPRLDGGVALRFRQEVDGIPVVGGEASVQVAPDGGVLSSLADLSADAPRLVPPTSTVSGGVARRAAVEATARDTGADPSTLAAAAPAQWIYDPAVLGPPSPLGPRLTWRVEVTSADGTVDQLVLIDAERGGAVLSFSQLADGLERRICDAANIRGPQPCSAPYARIEGQPPVPGGGGADEVNLAYTYAGHTYDFFLDHFGRDGIDGAGSAIRIKVRYCSTEPASPCPYANAFWSPAYDQAIFGQGYARADDVVAHELTHGVTEATANLYYWYQSGAISESMSDVFGELVDQTNGTGRDGAGFRWRIGEDLPGGSLRHMATPTASPYLDPDRMTSSLYAADPTGIDAGGVHTNSGVGNRAAALITAGGTLNGQTVQGLGIDKTAAVYYETLTAMLTSASDYADLAVALPQACRNLIGEAAGITETDCTQVDKAVLATEMATQPTTPGAAAPEAPVCDSGLTPVPVVPVEDFEGDPASRWVFDTVDVPDVTDYRWAFQSEVSGVGYQTTPGGSNALWGGDVGATADRSARLSQPVTLPVGSTPYLHFRHAYGFESSEGSNWDGGVVEYSTNGAAGPWTDLGDRFVGPAANGYDGTLEAAGSNPLAGRPAFVGSSHGYVSSRADLTPLAGQSILLRFRLGEDKAVGTSYGWFVDDLRIYTCETPAPGAAVTLTAEESTVTVGQTIHLHTTVHNDSNTPLSNVVVEVADCTESIGSLAVGATTEVACDHATADPEDLGAWTATASVTADELDEPVASNEVTVSVLAPDTARLALTQQADQESVDLGQPVDLHLTLRNTGNVAVDLTGAVVSTPSAPACQSQALPPSLGVGAETTVSCSVTPTATGPWTSTATVTTDQTGEVAAAPVSVLVLDATPPTITVTRPAASAIYNQGSTVTASYTCTDDQAAGVASCVGPVANGAPIDTTTAGTHDFTVTATDQDGNQAQTTATYTVANRRPDGRIRAGTTGALAGDDRYNLTGARQNRTVRAVRGARATFFVSVQNDGSHAERLAVRGQPGTTNYGVRYYSAGVDVTAAVRRGTYRTPNLAPGVARTIKVVVTVGNRAPVGSKVDRLVTITSTNDASRQDVVRFIVKRR